MPSCTARVLLPARFPAVGLLLPCGWPFRPPPRQFFPVILLEKMFFRDFPSPTPSYRPLTVPTLAASLFSTCYFFLIILMGTSERCLYSHNIFVRLLLYLADSTFPPRAPEYSNRLGLPSSFFFFFIYPRSDSWARCESTSLSRHHLTAVITLSHWSPFGNLYKRFALLP